MTETVWAHQKAHRGTRSGARRVSDWSDISSVHVPFRGMRACVVSWLLRSRASSADNRVREGATDRGALFEHTDSDSNRKTAQLAREVLFMARAAAPASSWRTSVRYERVSEKVIRVEVDPA
jgi:hypothetical protein